MLRASRGRVAFALVAVVAAAVVLVAAGRFEGARALDAQLDGIDRLRAAAGPTLDNPRLTGYRLGKHHAPYNNAPFDCLLYSHGRLKFAIQLCFDSDGNLVEAIDRRGAEHVYYSVAGHIEHVRVKVKPFRIERILRTYRALPQLPARRAGI